jgi:UDP-N-acetylmuramoylalanine--D-glutamate ligase
MKIAIAGYGLEGKSNYEYFNTPENQVVIIDERELQDAPVDASVITGERAYERLAGYDIVVRTAGLAPSKIKTDAKIWSASNEFFAKCPAPIIGVTGSKGKGTTCSLIASMLREAGHTVHLVGNIGVPALDILSEIEPEDIVVYELSSFQLWDLGKSPHVAVVLMIEPDHLDVHASFDEYVQAKSNIRLHQTENDVCFYHPTNPYSRQIAEINLLQNAHRYNDSTDQVSVYVESGMFNIDGSAICPVSSLQLPGAHNSENACAAISVALKFTDDFVAIERGLQNFSGLDHRLKFVHEVGGVGYYDDSIATTPGSAIAAMKAFEQPKIMVLGGSSKTADFTEMAQTAAEYNVKLALVIGAEAEKIEQALQKNGIPLVNLGQNITMGEIVRTANAHAEPGDVVVLSPACASFDMFKSYSDRGDQFITAVEKL